MSGGRRQDGGARAVKERVAAARRAAQLRQEAEERVAAEPEPTTSTPKRRKGGQGYNFTAEDITKLRDEQGLSWRQVAVNLDLGSPGLARKAYTDLTGRDYHDSVMTGRRAKSDPLRSVRPRRKVFAPEWNDESDQDEIIERVSGATIVVERTLRGVQTEEEISVGRVTKLTWDGKDQHLCVHFIDRYSGGERAVLVSRIKEVR
jgi:hypothetical protein